ncbi:uncharacterized protein LOC144656291 [Oculina patagonica]
MVLKYKDKEISSLDDIQKLTAKDLRDILRSHSETTGGAKADLVLKVYALLMREVLPANANSEDNQEVPSVQDQDQGQVGEEFKYDAIMRKISALGWSSDLRHLPEMNFIQLYDYLVVSTRKYRHIVLKGTHYKKLKSYQFFFEGNVKKLEVKLFENKTYVRANVLPSMKKTPYRVVVEFSPTCDVLRAACTCPAGLGLNGKGKCNHVGGVLFAIEDFIRRGLQNNPEPLTCTSRLSVWVVPRNQSVAAKPLDKVLIRKIRFGKKNIRTQPKIIRFDPRAPQHRTRDEEGFKALCENLQNCLHSSSFFLFHDLKSKCASAQSSSTLDEGERGQDSTPFTDNYDIATERFKSIVDEHVSNMTITEEEILETERLTRGQNKNQHWFDKRKQLLTASNFGKAAKTKVEPSKKIKAMLYANFTTEAVQYGIESEEKAAALYIREMAKEGVTVKVEEVGLLQSKEKPFLAASLDRIVTNLITKEKWGMEIKSPLSKAGMRVEDACKNKNFFLEKLSDGMIRLKRNHDYYIQVQGQLYAASNLALKGIIFVVYFGEEMPLFIENIHFDGSRWNDELLPRLEYFFKRAFFPEMLTKRVERGKLLYLHGGWIPFGHYSCSANGLKLRFSRSQ